MDCCVGCEDGPLEEPYIMCTVCTSPTYKLCVYCFAKGWENGIHLNSHEYEIKRNDFYLLQPGWTAKDEVLLLDAVRDCGLGNWSDVAVQMGRSEKECESHYNLCYIENAHSELPKLSCPYKINKLPPIPFKETEHAPRPAVDSQLFYDMAGYMAARGDFVTEYDEYAELDLGDIEFNQDDEPLDTELKKAVVDIYNNRMRERMRRKRIIRDYGLLNMRRIALSWQENERHIPRTVMKQLRPFTRLVTCMDFDMFIASVSYEGEVKERIQQLNEFREAGLTYFRCVELFQRMKKRREQEQIEPKALTSMLIAVNSDSGHSRPSSSVDTSTQGQGRKPSARLNITGLPGLDQLTDTEKELCSTVRVVPEAFLEFKNILLNEYHKSGSLKLAQARLLIKIDVNKTRKIYDYLVQSGQVHKGN